MDGCSYRQRWILAGCRCWTIDITHCMKVSNIVPSISNEASGPSYSVVRLCEALLGIGVDVTLAALDWGPVGNPPTFLKTYPLGRGPRRLGRSPGMRAWLEDEARMKKVDLLHNHSLWMMPNVYPGWVSRRHRLSYIVSPRGTLSAGAMREGSFIKGAFWRMIQRPALEHTTCFHATSHAEYADIRRSGFRQPVAVIPNGMDLPVLHPRRDSVERTLLFLGRIHPIKGIDTLLKAWGSLQGLHPEWVLRIVGPDDGGHLSKMKSMAAKLDLRRIDFPGPLYGKEKLAAYAQADLFVLPSHSENFGVSVAEALASGVPAVVSKGAPWSGLVDHDAGWWVDEGLDPLVAALQEAMSTPLDILEGKGTNGRRWMQSDFSWDRIGRLMSETYEWVLNRGVRPECVVLD